ncbi:chromosome partitioning protein [Skermanella aerolata]|uniref:AAA family ATPase n=1 Tax=Skermanella aerolata TaxID=393310 RepID=UPI003D1B2D6B
MTFIASLASTKGGVGKTALLLSVATELRLRGMRILILDCDPNRNLVGWAKQRADDGMTVIDGVTENNILDIVAENSAEFDAVLIDLAGFGNLCMLYAYSTSDLLLVPTQKSKFDIAECVKTVTKLREQGRIIAHQPDIAVVVTRTKAAIRSRVDLHAAAQLEKKGVPVLSVQLIERDVIAEMTYTGKGPCETSPGGNADLNVKSLTDEVIARIAAAAPNPSVKRRPGSLVPTPEEIAARRSGQVNAAVKADADNVVELPAAKSARRKKTANSKS